MNNGNFSELDEMMGYSAENLSDIFKSNVESASTSKVYRAKCDKVEKSNDNPEGHYFAKVRLMRNPYNRKRSVVHSTTYNIHDAQGYLTVVSSMSDVEDTNSPYFNTAKQCPLFKGWKAVRYSEDPAVNKRKDNYKRKEGDYMYCQILEDENQPDMVGKIMPMKVAAAIIKKMNGKLNPSKQSGKAPVDVLNYLYGSVLNLEVVPGPGSPNDKDGRFYRETNYDLCDFDTDEICPIRKIDNTPLFTDEEIAVIERYNGKLKAIAKMKSPEEQKKSWEILKANKLFTDVQTLMKRAMDYVKENTKDLVEEVGYTPWDEATTARVNAWIAANNAGLDPAGSTTPATVPAAPTATTETAATSGGYATPGCPDVEEDMAEATSAPTDSFGGDDDDIPF